MIRPYAEKQTALIRPYLSDIRSLLDFGCGDLSLAKELKLVLPAIKITGVDVVDSGARASGIDFRVYDGRRLPYKNRSFDATIAYHVFHHCTDPKASLADVSRVTKKTLLMVEPVYRNSLDLFFMKILDRASNGWRGVAIPMPFTFQKESTWVHRVKDNGWTVNAIAPAGVLPGWLPFGETKLFVLTRFPRGQRQ